MGDKYTTMSDPLYQYLLGVSLRESDVLRRLREETGKLEDGRMQIGPDQGQFMALLVKLTNARRILEIGTFTGYSSLCMASALPPEGRLTACDVSDEWTFIARRYWLEAGVADKIDLRLGPATETLDALMGEGLQGSFDMAFIDADKENYGRYYEGCLRLLRPGGVILIDNVLWDGAIIDDDDQREPTLAIRDLNAQLKDDPRVEISLLTIGDGLTLARIKE